MENRSNNLMVGAVTLILVFALAIFTIWLAGAGSRNRVEYDIFFKQSVDGLSKGSQVTYSGVPAGQVKEIALWVRDPQYVRVRIEVDQDIPVRVGTTASINGVGFTGVSQIALDGGVANAPLITDNGPAGKPVIPARLAGLGELLNSAPQLLQRISTLTERLTQLADDRNQQSLSNILANIDRVTGNLARNGPQIDAALAEARVSVQQAGAAAEQIGRLAGTTNDLLDQQGRPMVADLRQTAANANRAIAAMQQTIEEARPGLQSFSSQTVPQANALIQDLRRTASSLSAIADRIDQQGAGAVVNPRLPDYEPR